MTLTRQAGLIVWTLGVLLVNNRLGSGSDYTVFLNFIGVPIVDMSFTGPSGVYHSIYDNHRWMQKFGDPGFRYHAAMTQLWGVMALRLANADVAPLDYRPYAARVRQAGRIRRGGARTLSCVRQAVSGPRQACVVGQARGAAVIVRRRRGDCRR